MTLIAVVAAGALASCGRKTDYGVPTETVPMEPIRTLSPEEAARLTSLPWTLSSIDPSEMLVTVESTPGECRRVEGSQIELTATSVTIAVLGARDKGCRHATGPSTRSRSPVPVMAVFVVRLPEPLGSRSLLHAPTTERHRS
ncbi:hypothetical protein ACNTMW_14870 [Planosporangium sp. 12N6]|uniref:hypothetical protein n=1 Tax=Planosporangium spinosum TaxID=3402278 RepID=UPI003CE8AAFE